MSYDENRPSLHTEMEEAAKESRAEKEKRIHESQKNRTPDLTDADQVRGRSAGLPGAMLVDHSVREGNNEPADDLATGAVVPPRHTESGDWEVDKAALGGPGTKAAQPAVSPFPVEGKSKGSAKSES